MVGVSSSRGLRDVYTHRPFCCSITLCPRVSLVTTVKRQQEKIDIIEKKNTVKYFWFVLVQQFKHIVFISISMIILIVIGGCMCTPVGFGLCEMCIDSSVFVVGTVDACHVIVSMQIENVSCFKSFDLFLI